MPLYDWRCDDGHTAEAIRSSSQREMACTSCSATAYRQVTNRVAIVGPTTDMRGMFRRYTEASQEIGAAATSALWPVAKSQALAMTAAGEAPPIKKEG